MFGRYVMSSRKDRLGGKGKMAGQRLTPSSQVDWQKRHQEQLKKEEDAWEKAKRQWKMQRRRKYM